MVGAYNVNVKKPITVEQHVWLPLIFVCFKSNLNVLLDELPSQIFWIKTSLYARITLREGAKVF